MQIFIIDDSNTMRAKHWGNVCKTFEALSYMTKAADPNGIELVLTSNPTEPETEAQGRTQKLVRFLNAQNTRDRPGSCNMEDSLSTVFERIKAGLGGGAATSSSRKSLTFSLRRSTQARGVNVYIFTDGVWEGGDETKCGVEGPITTLIKQMKSAGKDRTYVALQFIQFGDDRLGEERLDCLDNELGRELAL